MKWLLIAMLLVCASCQYDPRVPYTDESENEDYRSALKSLSGEERDFVVAYRQFRGVSDGRYNMVRVSEAVELGKILARNASIMKTMQDACSVRLVGKEVSSRSSWDHFEWFANLGFKITNKSKKDIVAIKGTVTLVDVFGNVVYPLELEMERLIPAGLSTEWSGGFVVEAADVDKIKSKKLKAIWSPDVLVFADGSRMNSVNGDENE